MAKAPSISDAARIGQEIASKASQKPRKALQESEPISGVADYTTTSISLPEDLFDLLKAVSEHRARTKRGKPGPRVSVSAVIVDVLQRNRGHLEDEAGMERVMKLAKR